MPRISRVIGGMGPWISGPLVAWILLAVVGYMPTRTLGGDGAVRAMLTAQAAVVVVVYGTLAWAMVRMSQAGPSNRYLIAMKAGSIRFVLTLIIGAIIGWRGGIDRTVFLVWVAVAYVVMIMVETLTLISWSRRLESRH